MTFISVTEAVESEKVVIAAANDGFTNCLARVVGALDAALIDVVNDHAAAQLSRFTKILCERSGGDICERTGELEFRCNVGEGCALAKKCHGFSDH
jgi:hypothetical protein